MICRSHRAVFLAALIIALLPAGGPAWAHAIVVDSVPTIDSVLTGPVVNIRLRFNSRIDHNRSILTLFGPDGKGSPLYLDGEVEPDILSTRVEGLAPGDYRLRWQVLAVDGHITRGDIPFHVTAP
jgi:copper resistance protein C